MDIEIYTGLTDLPYFNPDMDLENEPESIQHFRRKIESADGILICSPEYIFALPGILKNALEWLVSTVLLENKPVALITASAIGEKAHEQLLLILNTMLADVKDTELLISGVRSKVSKSGEIMDVNVTTQLLQLSDKLDEKISNS